MGFPLRPVVAVASCLAALLVVTAPRSARAEDPKKAECAAAYEKSQEQRASGKLREARENLVVCSQAVCPAFVQSDCVQWLAEVQHDMPTVVISAKDKNGEDTVAVHVTLDGETLMQQLDGTATPMNPGMHRFRFELEGAAPIDQQVLVRQGQKDRAVEVSFAPPNADLPDVSPYAGSANSGGAPSADSSDNSRAKLRPYAYAAGSVGAAGILGFIVFGAVGHSAESDLESSGCKPNCSQSKVDGIKTKYLIADISLGVGIAGLGSGVAMFFLSQPKTATPPKDTALKFDVHATPTMGYATMSGRF